MKILQDFKNDLLKRRELVVDIQSESNPGMQGAVKALVDEFKAEENCIVVQKIDSKFGSDNFIISAFIYDSAADKGKIEPRPKQKKEKK